MRIAVIGGAGFAGFHLVDKLLSLGHQVLVYDNLFAGRKLSDLPWREAVKFAQADIVDASTLALTLKDFAPEVVYHIAAIHFIPYCDQNPDHAMRVNVEGTLAVMTACQQISSVRAVIFASSLAVYSTSSEWHQEDHPVSTSDIYGLTKVLGEQIVHQYAKQTGITSLCMRLTNLYGPEETNPHVIPVILGQLVEGQRSIKLGRTDTYRDFLYVKDCAEALVRLLPVALASELHENVNLASGTETTVTDVLNQLVHGFAREITVVVDESRIRKVDRLHLRADISKLRKLLGWTPSTPLHTGIQETISWAQQRVEVGAR